MKIVRKVEDVVNAENIPPGSVIYAGGNAATPVKLLQQLAKDKSIRDVSLLGVLFLGELQELFSEEACNRIEHRVIFNGPSSRCAVNSGKASYQLLHLSDIPRQVRKHLKPDIAFLSVAGPDNGGNYSFGTSVEACKAAARAAKAQGGLVIVERNAQMPFVLGTSIPESGIDYLVDTDYPIPISPVAKPDERSKKIAHMITDRYIHDGCTLQFGLGEVPEAVTGAIIDKGAKDLAIHTELFADAMRTLVQKGVVTHHYLENTFSMATIFLSADAAGYQWLHFNSSVQSFSSDITNYVPIIAAMPRMVSINSAIGVDLHGNIWADSLNATSIYSGIGGQADFIRGAYLSKGGVPIIAMKSTTKGGESKVLLRSPAGITTTAISADPVVIVTEQGIFDPRGLNMAEHAVAIAHLAAPKYRDELLRYIYDSVEYYKPRRILGDKPPKGFTPYEAIR